jgi:hypothetical protein
MKKQSLCHVWLGALTGVTLLLAGCSPPQGSQSQAVTAAVNAIWTRYSSSLNAGDLDSWLSLWTDDGVQLPPGEGESEWLCPGGHGLSSTSLAPAGPPPAA